MAVTIEPDTKDWTWVLDRPCPDCRYDAAAVDRETLPAAIRANAAAWQEVLRRDDARERPNPATWSPAEYACHVRDTLRIFDGRLRLMLEQDDPLFDNWDQDATALQDRYDRQAPDTIAPDLAVHADTIAARFATVTGEQWWRPGRRSNGSVFTVDSFARYFLHDPIHHLWDVQPDVPGAEHRAKGPR